MAALIGDDMPAEQENHVELQARDGLRELPIEKITSNRLNPRKTFNEAELEELAKSVKDKGILQPVVVRPNQDHDTYQIVAGERRWRAAQRAGLHSVPALIRDLNDQEVLEIAIIENVQRADLNPVEEAMGYQQLIDSFSYTQQQLAESIGKSRSHIANTLRLMALPKSVLDQLQEGQLTAGHARALIATDDPQSLAQKIIALGLSVRQAEALARNNSTANDDGEAKPKAIPDSNMKALEKAIAEAIGLRANVLPGAGEKGKLVINYKTLEQLEEICQKLGVEF